MLIKGKELLTLPVYTKSGQLLGEVDDVEIEIDNQMVVNYLVGSKSKIKNFFGNNKLVIHRSQVISIEADKIVVDDNVVQSEVLLAKKTTSEEPEMSAGVAAAVVKPANKN
jgi:sporulation protein YlmC with PRC-barrel domain